MHLMEVRLRFPELLDEHKPPLTPYALAKKSEGRISLSVAYRLIRRKGAARYFDSELLEALCDVLGVKPGDLLERETRRKGK